LKIAFLQHKSLLWSRYCRLQFFADNLLSEEAASAFRVSVTPPISGAAAPGYNTLDRFVRPFSREDIEASLSSLSERPRPVPGDAGPPQRKLTDLGFVRLTRQQPPAVWDDNDKPTEVPTGDWHLDASSGTDFDLLIDAVAITPPFERNRLALDSDASRHLSLDDLDDYVALGDAMEELASDIPSTDPSDPSDFPFFSEDYGTSE
jgi:hypothetical protein